MANGSEELVMVLMPKMGLEQPLAPMGTNSLANGNDGAVRYANWVSAADTYPASTADICPVSTEDIHPVPTADIKSWPAEAATAANYCWRRGNVPK